MAIDSRIVMKRQMCIQIFFFVVLLLIPFGIRAQFVVTQSLDYSRFPTLTAQVFAFDSTGNTVKLDSIRDRLVIEKTDNSTSQKLAVITSQPQLVNRVFSAVLCLDISNQSISNALKNGVKAWSASMNTFSESAITLFAGRPYIVQDFTTDTSRLNKVANTLQPLPGTNIDAAFREDFNGALSVLSRGKYRRVIILATDGLSPVNDSVIVDAANKLSAVIYILVVGNPATTELKNCASKTDGVCIDNISLSKLPYFFTVLSRLAQGAEPNVYRWTTDKNFCGSKRSTGFKINSLNVPSIEYGWIIPETYIPRLKVDETTKIIGNVKKDETRTTSFVLTATGNDIIINSISSPNPLFTLTPKLINYKLSKDSSVTLTCSFTGTDTILRRRITQVDIVSNSCSSPQIYIEANSYENPAITPRLASLRGGETIFANTDTLIQWSGVLPTDSVKIEFNSNEVGAQWETIVKGATGLSYKWHIPNKMVNATLRIALLHGEVFHYSGNTIKIIKPNVTVKSITSPVTRLGEQTEFYITDAIQNHNNSLLQIDSVSVNNNEFFVVSGLPATLISKAKLKLLEVRFQPIDTGFRVGTFTFYTNQGIVVIEISGICISNKIRPVQVINFGQIELGVTKDTIVNNAICLAEAKLITLNKLEVGYPDVEQFFYSKINSEIILSANQQCTSLQFQYKPTHIGRVSTRVITLTDNGEEYEFYLYGEGICNTPSTNVRLVVPDTIKTDISNKITIPIRLLGMPNSFYSTKRPYIVKLQWNKSTLIPESPTPTGEMTIDKRVVQIQGNGFETGDTLVTINAKTVWGNEQQFPIEILDFHWNDECPNPPTNKNGVLYLTNICYAGGTARLFIDTDTLSLTNIRPNPVTTYVEIQYSLRENGYTSIYVSDLFGRPVYEIFQGDMKSGSYEKAVDLGMLPTGQYVLVLHTPTKVITTLLGVSR